MAPARVNAEKDAEDELEMKVEKYSRGKGADLKALRDKKLKGQLAVKEKLYGQSAKVAAKAEKWLMPSEEGFLEPDDLEKTYRFPQESIVKEVDLLSSRKPFDMILPVLGPYTIEYTSNGRYMLVGGRKGHLAMMDMLNMDLIKEFQVRETVRDVAFLHNEQMYAVAQKKYPYIYNRHGAEIHCLKEHGKALKLQFLTKQFLLASINSFGQLHYQDVSTGEMIANYRTGLGRTDVMRANPYNAVIGLGHAAGKVTMWKPTSVKPLVTMLCHHGPVTALAFDRGGHLMATAGVDRKIKIWDLRKYEVVKSYAARAQSLDFSQKGLLACSNGSQVEIYRDFGGHDYRLYMKHRMMKGYQVGKVLFRPYEDILGIGHSMGLSSILVPGSGEPNFDTFIDNPMETTKQKREKEIHALLDKLPPDTIMLNPNLIATVRAPKKKEKKTKKEIEEEMEEAIEAAKNTEHKKKTKGRSKPSKRAKKKEEGVFRAKRPFLEQSKEVVGRPDKKQRIGEEVELPKALQRFAKKLQS
ncbi:putative U3 small nucleolar RNA-associated protein 7 isoform X1 [Panicum miliaceum]|uniref:U3 small nucleolar RNA-associated protein 7 isoform X1 n=1 Tax=Panicum miliaceum TaxID=4540 RepID=A0A3L6R0V2_PANMI|nr:putative U3 small nucleolar RNA-associated protein 7 isoform X1 [Panicum miliaceum]